MQPDWTELQSEYPIHPKLPVMLGKPPSSFLPTSEVVVVPSMKRSSKFGSVKVLDPLPVPNLVPIAAKSAA